MAINASTAEERRPSASALTQLLRKPSQEQIVLLITLALLVLFSVTLPGFSKLANLS
jgi:ribose transport system permease protein